MFEHKSILLKITYVRGKSIPRLFDNLYVVLYQKLYSDEAPASCIFTRETVL